MRPFDFRLRVAIRGTAELNPSVFVGFHCGIRCAHECRHGWKQRACYKNILLYEERLSGKWKSTHWIRWGKLSPWHALGRAFGRYRSNFQHPRARIMNNSFMNDISAYTRQVCLHQHTNLERIMNLPKRQPVFKAAGIRWRADGNGQNVLEHCGPTLKRSPCLVSWVLLTTIDNRRPIFHCSTKEFNLQKYFWFAVMSWHYWSNVGLLLVLITVQA